MDPRVRRTRQLLQQALEKLLETRAFETLSIQDITDAATLNRGTFYDHYPDKFALLECMAAGRFHDLLAARGIIFGGSCASALRAIVLGVCDYLSGLPAVECEQRRQLEPHMESAIIAVVWGMILDGLKRHAPSGVAPPEMIATTISWAIYGAAKEWLRTPHRPPSEQAADTIMKLVAPIFPTEASGGTSHAEIDR
ncbi:MAG: TetR/AcrR family transcriptional regulator [Chthoniobacter sp.]